MQMRAVVLSGVLLFVATACSDANEPPTPGPPVTTTLSCAEPDGDLVACSLALAEAGGFRVTLTSTDCTADGNIVRLTAPVAATLTSDGCREDPPVVWEYAGPYDAGTTVGIEVEAPSFPNPATLVATGAFPTWTLRFEDGVDSDQNDLILTVEAITTP